MAVVGGQRRARHRAGDEANVSLCVYCDDGGSLMQLCLNSEIAVRSTSPGTL